MGAGSPCGLKPLCLSSPTLAITLISNLAGVSPTTNSVADPHLKRCV